MPSAVTTLMRPRAEVSGVIRDTWSNAPHLREPRLRHFPDASAFKRRIDWPFRQTAKVGPAVALEVSVASEGIMERAGRAAERSMTKLKAELQRLKRDNQRLEALAYRDPLTGLRNRRYFSERLREELCRLRRTRTSALSVLCIDVNDFKSLNDSLGHAAGDTALVAVGRLLESLMRTSDLVCRVGGDEFVVLLPDTDAVQVKTVAARLRAHLPALAVVGLGHRGLSLGAATYEPGDDELRLLSKADEEMYEDKRGCRRPDAHVVTEQFAGAA
jgi:diguanylate cyclase (GGDEF)-like protein